MKLPAIICLATVVQCREQNLEVTVLATAKPALWVGGFSAVPLALPQKEEKIQDASTPSSLHISSR